MVTSAIFPDFDVIEKTCVIQPNFSPCKSLFEVRSSPVLVFDDCYLLVECCNIRLKIIGLKYQQEVMNRIVGPKYGCFGRVGLGEERGWL